MMQQIQLQNRQEYNWRFDTEAHEMLDRNAGEQRKDEESE